MTATPKKTDEATDTGTFLVAGATGNVGHHIVSQLADLGMRVRALTRKPSKARFPAGVEVRQGDLGRPETLEEALEGVSGLHLITIGGDDYRPLQTGEAILEAAERHGVKRLTILSDGRDSSVERAARESLLEWTILQPADFMSNALFWTHSIATEGVIREPFGSIAKTMIHEADVAAVAASILVHGGHAGKTYALTGPEVLTVPDKARIIAEVTGRPVRYVEVSEDHQRSMMKEFGIGDDIIDYVIAWNGNPPAAYRTTNGIVETVTGRKPRTFASWVQEHAAAFMSAAA